MKKGSGVNRTPEPLDLWKFQKSTHRGGATRKAAIFLADVVSVVHVLRWEVCEGRVPLTSGQVGALPQLCGVGQSPVPNVG